ncbi:hypothetical protein BRM3_00355 [Brachybacterium huguangmaarense]|uniref:Uncharacterized protein n=1 Tax=Brachybacterium huguangmaarense TaxID=1652028 RepID=A0ABY6G149_9MICO|nr:hypothetical protein [Brachybacterium huguangmaarense]UYG16927.1 hypothetical protein BRM3_00355 [Brachybacterium huguangmaarense]
MSGALLTAGLTVLAEGPSDGGDFTPTSVTPGVAGFIVVFLIGLATLLLILDMTRRIRRVQARARVAERHRDEDAAREAGEDPAADDEDRRAHGDGGPDRTPDPGDDLRR